MYSKFTCTDLTANFASTDLTSDSFMSADATPTTSPTANLDALRKQLEAATAELNKQNQIYADNKTYWDACQYKSPAFKRAGFYHNGVYADSDCKNARDRMATAQTKISQLTAQIKTLNESIDKVTASTVATNPALQAAKAEAEAKATVAKAQADAAIKQSETVGAATASRNKIIGYTIAAVILLAGITWAVVKLRKPKA